MLEDTLHWLAETLRRYDTLCQARKNINPDEIRGNDINKSILRDQIKCVLISYTKSEDDLATIRKSKRLVDTPLQYACSYCDLDLVMLLVTVLKYDANDLLHTNDEKQNLLHSIASSKTVSPETNVALFKSVLLTLQKQGKDVTLMTQPDKDGNTPIDYVEQFGKEMLVPLIEPYAKLVVNQEEKIAPTSEEKPVSALKEKTATPALEEPAGKFAEIHQFFMTATPSLVFLHQDTFRKLLKRIQNNEPLSLEPAVKKNTLWSDPSTAAFDKLLDALVNKRPSRDELKHYLAFLRTVHSAKPSHYTEWVLPKDKQKNLPRPGSK